MPRRKRRKPTLVPLRDNFAGMRFHPMKPLRRTDDLCWLSMVFRVGDQQAKACCGVDSMSKYADATTREQKISEFRAELKVPDDWALYQYWLHPIRDLSSLLPDWDIVYRLAEDGEQWEIYSSITSQLRTPSASPATSAHAPADE